MTPSWLIPYERANEELVNNLPELKAQYDVELEWWREERPGPHVVFGDLLNPYIERLLESRNENALRKVFGFVETLASNGDERVKNLVAVTVCEGLRRSPQNLQAARQYMGPNTLRSSQEIEDFWGKP